MADSDRQPINRMPRWVKVSLILAVALVVAFLVLKLTGIGGEHGPSRHLPGIRGGQSAPAVDHSPPPGGHG